MKTKLSLMLLPCEAQTVSFMVFVFGDNTGELCGNSADRVICFAVVSVSIQS